MKSIFCFDDLMAGEERSHFWRFGGDEAEAVEAVTAEEPADGPIAESAVAIEDDQKAVADLGEFAHLIWMKARWYAIQFGGAKAGGMGFTLGRRKEYSCRPYGTASAFGHAFPGFTSAVADSSQGYFRFSLPGEETTQTRPWRAFHKLIGVSRWLLY